MSITAKTAVGLEPWKLKKDSVNARSWEAAELKSPDLRVPGPVLSIGRYEKPLQMTRFSVYQSEFNLLRNRCLD